MSDHPNGGTVWDDIEADPSPAENLRAVVETVHDKAEIREVAERVADWSAELNRRLK
ncbi:hypothetical protein ACXYTP_05140 [Tsukamurella ocularis]|uniref:hypothetical protein n=1 Tax=Tsukamurella ocularis TaxID=1970234 RepID=UPI0039EFDAE2